MPSSRGFSLGWEDGNVTETKVLQFNVYKLSPPMLRQGLKLTGDFCLFLRIRLFLISYTQYIVPLIIGKYY